ncbi:MAG: hypothetical protein QOD85_2680 [Gaiellaceae bacterium]|jgi:hypothetical protein|nr:hypothetical protein [Gaiellaceae bacterium]
MEQFRRLPLGRQLVLGAGILLLIDTFLPWQKVSVLGFSHSWNAWHGFWGTVMGLATIVLVAWVILRVLDVKLPFEAPDGLTTLGLAALILVFAVIKNLADDYSAWGSYLGIVLAAVVAYGGWLTFAASGEKLPQHSSYTGGGTGTATGGPATTDENPPDVEPV